MAAKKASVTDDQIRTLRAKAEEAGNRSLVSLCHAALRGERKAWRYVAALILEPAAGEVAS